jgi:hypothetical protein
MLKHGEIHELPKMDLFTLPVELDLMVELSRPTHCIYTTKHNFMAKF